MKKKGSFLVIVLSLLCTVLLTACNEKLATPNNLQVSEMTLTWNPVTKATSYVVSIDGDEESVENNEYSLAELLDIKTYQIKIKAVDSNGILKDSGWSDLYQYKIEDDFNSLKGNRTGDGVTGVTITGWTYGDVSCDPELNFGAAGKTIVTYLYEGIGSTIYNSDKRPEDAGTYKIIAFFGATDNFNVTTVETNFTISKANRSHTVSLAGWKYGSAANNPIVSGIVAEGAKVTYYYDKSINGGFSTTVKPAVAGTYYVKAQIAETANYNAYLTPAAMFTISKANRSHTVSLAGWKYGGAANNPMVSGTVAEGAKVTYYYDKSINGGFSTTVKPAVAGTYYVKAQIAETANYNAYVTSAVMFTISKANRSHTVSLAGWKYGSAANNPIVSGIVAEGAKVTYYYDKSINGGFSTTVKPAVAGTYYVKAQIAETANYNAYLTPAAMFTISKANRTHTVSLAGWTYGGASKKPNMSGTVAESAEVTYYYDTSISGSFSSTKKPADAGTYYVKARIAKTANYNAYITSAAMFTISKANRSHTVSLAGWTYGGVANNPIVSGNAAESAKVTYYYDTFISGSFNSAIKPADTGTYYIKAQIAETANYNSFTTPVVSFTIAKANGTASVSITGWIVGQSAKQPSSTIAPSTADYGSPVYEYKLQSANDDAYTTTVPATAGNYTVRVTYAATVNCNAATATTNFTIAAQELAAPSNVKVSGTTLNWSAVSNAIGYKVYINGVEYSVTGNSYSLAGIATGSHILRVSAKGDGISYLNSGWSDNLTYSTGGFTSDLNYSLVYNNTAYAVAIGSSKATEIIIPAFYNGLPVRTISHNAFRGCSSLKSVIIGSNVLLVLNYAFDGCSSLTSVTIPDNVTNIGASAFSGCSSLVSITIGSGVITIGASAFSNCAVLNIITVKSGNAVYKSDGNCLIQISDNVLIAGCKNSIIPNYVTSIGSHAFLGSGITSITIPNYVASIGYGAFSSCKSLINVTIGNGVTSIGSSAFVHSGLTSVTIPNSVVMIENSVFSECKSLKSVTIGSGIKSITDYMFEGCTALTNIKIPDGVTSIGFRAFYKCGLSSITIGSGVTSIGSNAFTYSGLTSVTIPNNVINIGADAFSFCSGLKSVTIGSGVKSIGDYAFYYCESLTSVIIPNSVTGIGVSAFMRCTSLKSATIGSGITSISEDMFEHCTALADIKIPNGVKSIGASAFSLCESLKSVTIGSGVTSIGDSAFYYCIALTSVIIPNNVKSIGVSAFSRCTSLTSVTIGSGVTSIGNYAFYSCSGLTSIIIPIGVTTVGADVFQYCDKLTIRCAAASKPSGWQSSWNPSNRPVVWNYK